MNDLKFNLDDFAFLWWTAQENFTHEQPHRFEVNDKYTSRPYKDGEGWLYWVGHEDGAADALLALMLGGVAVARAQRGEDGEATLRACRRAARMIIDAR